MAARTTSCRREGDVEGPETLSYPTLAAQIDALVVYLALAVAVLAWHEETTAGGSRDEEEVLGKRRANAPLLLAHDAKQAPFIFSLTQQGVEKRRFACNRIPLTSALLQIVWEASRKGPPFGLRQGQSVLLVPLPPACLDQ